MANNKEEAGKGTPRPGEMPGGRRTYATLDLTAAEVGGRAAPAPATSPTSAGVFAGPQSTAQTTSEANAPPKSQSHDKSHDKPRDKSDTKPIDPAAASADPAFEGARARPGDGRSSSTLARLLSVPWLSHLASGALGALLVVLVTELATPPSPPRTPELPPEKTPVSDDLLRRVADLENALGTRAGVGVRARMEELTRSMAALTEAQIKLARDAKAVESK